MPPEATTAPEPTDRGSPWRFAYPALLGMFAALYVWRMSGLAPAPGVSAHLSNLYLTGAATVLLGGPRLFSDPPARRRALVAAAVLVGVNLAAEVGLRVVGIDESVNSALGGVNTSDPLDALYGVTGAALVIGLLAVSARSQPVASSAPLEEG